MVDVQTISLDSLNLSRIDLIKIDVEGMELDVLEGAANSIAKLHPMLFVETLKSDKDAIRAWLQNLGYTTLDVGFNFFAIHGADKGLAQIKLGKPAAA
jgi:hypothetical protein